MADSTKHSDSEQPVATKSLSSVQEFAQKHLGITLFPAQLKMIDGWQRGVSYHFPRAMGKSTARDVYRKYQEQVTTAASTG